MRTIIAGSRGITDYLAVCLACKKCGWGITEVVSGGAKGVDRMGERWANEHGVPIRQFIPDWVDLGKGAGFIRNKAMAGYAVALIAIWDGESRGTKHMIDTAMEFGLRVYIMSPTGNKSFPFIYLHTKPPPKEKK
jgi:hypothetical protein